MEDEEEKLLLAAPFHKYMDSWIWNLGLAMQRLAWGNSNTPSFKSDGHFNPHFGKNFDDISMTRNPQTFFFFFWVVVTYIFNQAELKSEYISEEWITKASTFKLSQEDFL